MTKFEVIMKEHPQFVKEVLAHCVPKTTMEEIITGKRQSFNWYNSAEDEHEMKFLNEIYVQPVLDAIEKKYLSDVIRPFKNKVESIRKTKCDNLYYIEINMAREYDRVCLPYFSSDSRMYKGMKLNKVYTLNELGL